MNKPFKIKISDYDNIYFGSDFHYNHQRDFLFKPRGFSSYQEHDAFIENECGKLTKNDLLKSDTLNGNLSCFLDSPKTLPQHPQKNLLPLITLLPSYFSTIM